MSTNMTKNMTTKKAPKTKKAPTAKTKKAPTTPPPIFEPFRRPISEPLWMIWDRENEEEREGMNEPAPTTPMVSTPIAPTTPTQIWRRIDREDGFLLMPEKEKSF